MNNWCLIDSFISYSQKCDTLRKNINFHDWIGGQHMENNKSPEKLETTEYTSWQRRVLFLLRWGAWTASFMAMAHIMNF